VILRKEAASAASLGEMDDPHEFGSGLRAHLGFEYDETTPPLDSTPPREEPDPREEELARRLAYLAAAEEALVERERQVIAREHDVQGREARAAEEEVQTTVDVRAFLRRRAEQQADGLWRAFADALEAKAADGAPDHLVRLAATRALLAEAYDAPGSPSGLEDELARLRTRRTGSGTP
jgi:hypothetical protein